MSSEEPAIEASAPPVDTHKAQEASEKPADGDAEWLDLSTRWLLAPGGPQPAAAAEEHESADWADSLAAQVAPRERERGSAPPPPPRRRSSVPPPPTARTHDTWAYGWPAVSQRAALTAAQAFVPHAPEPFSRRHATLHGLQPAPEPRLNTTATDRQRDSEPWREESSYTDARQPATEATSWSGYPAASSPVPPWAAGIPPYAPPPWAATMPPYAAWAGTQLQPGAMPPWAANAGYPPDAHARPGTGAYRTEPRESGSFAKPSARAFQLEHWASVGNVWLTSLAKLALAAMALHYSGLDEPLLAGFGYAPAQASAPQVIHHEPQPQVPLPVQSAPIPAAASVIPEPVPAAAAAPAPAPKRAAARHNSAEPQRARASAAPQPSAAQQPAEPKASVGDATLRINSRPWSQVFVDGTLVGNTPRLDLRVSAGSHHIRLVNPDLDLSKSFEMQAVAGEVVSRVELLAQ